MSNVAFLALFVVFIAIIVVIRVTGDRRAVIALFVYVIVVHAVLAVTRRDAWPFVTHGVFLESGNEYRPLSSPRFLTVDRNGVEHGIDPRVWSPVSDRTLGTWWLMNSRRLTTSQKDEALAFLLRKAQSPPKQLFFAAPNWYSVDAPPPLRGTFSPLRGAKGVVPAPSPRVSGERVAEGRVRGDSLFAGIRVLLVTRVPAEKLATGAESSQIQAQYPR